MLGGVEAGGTKFVLACGDDPMQIAATSTIPTTDPATTLQQASDWFAQHGALAAIGIGSFGPVELDPQSPRWGRITDTPKPGWQNIDIAGYFAHRFDCPVGFDTDVNAAALAEWHHGAGQHVDRDHDVLAYVTIGTGIGGGLIVGGQPVHGAGHPEMGHMFPRRGRDDDGFGGICPFHGDCVEGLASGPAIAARWGAALSDLPADHAAHGLVAGYLAQLCHNLFAMTAATTIIMGGGVMQTPGLLARVAARAAELGSGYFPGRDRQQIVAPGLAGRSGIIGAMMLAQGALEPHR
jgi:fructokinase